MKLSYNYCYLHILICIDSLLCQLISNNYAFVYEVYVCVCVCVCVHVRVSVFVIEWGDAWVGGVFTCVRAWSM